MAVSVTALGVGEAQDPDFPNTSMVAEAAGFRLLIDCGHSAASCLWQRFPDADAIDAVYFTHLHPDHCFGIIPLLLRWKDQGRRKPLRIHTTRGGVRFFGTLFRLARISPPRRIPFPVVFAEVPRVRAIGPFSVTFARTQHSIANHAIRLEADGIALAFSGDGCPTPASIELFAGVDGLFHECYDLKPQPAPRYHCDVKTCLDLAEKTLARRLFLVHVRHGSRAAVAAALPAASKIRLLKPDDTIAFRRAGG